METAQQQNPQAEVAASNVARTDISCFLCAYGPPHCRTALVEGELLRVSERVTSDRLPAVLIATADGERVGVLLNDYARSLAKALSALPPERWRGLHVRLYHLAPLTFRPSSPASDVPPNLPQTPDVTPETALPADLADSSAPVDTAYVATGADHGDGVEQRADRWLRLLPAGAIILEPDLLLNITDINNAEYCVRQYPLRRMVPSAPTLATLRGVAIHQAFKELLKSGRHAPEDLAVHRDLAVRNAAVDLALRQIPPETLAAEIDPHMEALAQWYAGRRNTLWSQGEAPHIRAETFLLAPEVGLKGRLDFFLREEHGDLQGGNQGGNQGDALLELKTGQARGDLPKRAHRWQVFGYQTLLSVRRPVDSRRPNATLLYSATAGQAEAYIVPFALRDLHRVLDLRNLLALTHATGIVPSPPGGAKCSRCSLRPDCGKASALLGWEAPPDETPAMQPDRDDATWFSRMYDLLRLEQRAAEEASRTLWRLSPDERIEMGIALGNLTMEGEPRQTASGEWEYSFKCENRSELREGDAILLSDGDPVSGEIVAGSVLRLDQHGATVWTPERIIAPALIDRYGSDIVHDRTVRNLWRWLDVDPHLRGLVAGRIAPSFDGSPMPDELADLPVTFNAEQRMAAARALSARDFLLVQGPPGTGKTSVVAEIVRQALARGERVLLAAFTNQAVDNALRRIIGAGCENVVRLGHTLSVARDLGPYRLSNASHDLSPQQMRERLLRADLVAATTATWSAEQYDEVGEPFRFDLAIVDEATQIATPALLGALRFVRRFVLVGDERQLPPLVMSQQAAQGGLKHSLFSELLARWGDTASVALRKQYRMRPEICAFPSEAFYAGALVADGEARTATLEIAWEPSDPLAPILDPARPMIFVDTPPPLGYEEPMGKVSVIQADAARRITLALRAAGVPAEEIGVIAPYRAQVAAIRQRLAVSGETGVVVDTVDRFQGAERDVMLFSFGGLPPGPAAHLPGTHGQDFLADPHRLNVALTRARRKLILIGDRRKLMAHPLLRSLIQYCAGLYDGRGGLITARFNR